MALRYSVVSWLESTYEDAYGKIKTSMEPEFKCDTAYREKRKEFNNRNIARAYYLNARKVRQDDSVSIGNSKIDGEYITKVKIDSIP